MKLQRAEEHLGQLRREHAEFLNRNPYRMLQEDDPRRGEWYYLWRAKIVEHPPYEKWASLVGECAHSLRSALDHAAYAVVNAEKLVSETCGFPILEKPGSWPSSHPKDLPGVSPEMLAYVERLQPYNRPKETDPLWAVHKLDIIDKHRRLGLVNSTVEGTYWQATVGHLTDIDGGIGPFADGAVVGRFKVIPDPDSGVQMQTHFAFGIAMGEGEPREGHPVLPVLADFLSYVGGVIAGCEDFL